MTANPGTARHRSHKTRDRVIKALPAVAVVTIASLTVAGPANAAPSQPGVTSPQGSQPGVTTTPAPVTPAPVVTEGPKYLPGYTPLYDYSESRTVDDYNAGRQQPSYDTAPAIYESAPAPVHGLVQDDGSQTPVPASEPEPAPAPTIKRTKIVPIKTPENTVLVGANPVPYDPAVVDPTLARQVSDTLQAVQADGGNFLVDQGLADAPRADRIAAGTAAGAIGGATAGLLVGLAPAAVITGTGTAIGLAIGATAAVPVIPVAPLGYVFIPGLGAALGAGTGAVVSVPIVLGSTVIGAVTGGVLGAAAAGGEATVIEEPAPQAPPTLEAPLPGLAADQLPAIPAPLTLDGPALLAQANTAADSAAPIIEEAVANSSVWTDESAYEAVQGFTSTVLEQPAVADTVTAVNTAAAPVLDQANAALAGLQANLLPA
ncbi:hypothetical protein QMK17_22865 [Rhodococcus sp. G-MC3]|uniref:hypothetical protein n=1 Tax=Rhodococcus sp. G-MC3 TaxID=3046209 RepID=UPI0024BBBBE2|nr:hypothetical protein [Rhodococcus sp. G-MC3]MDJ0396164.1 hypothetical protein [Rhodococcus sp. G-MC3]